MTKEKVIDLRAEVRSRPTAEMWRVMQSAEIGWAWKGEDENVRELEAYGAEATKKEASVFLATTSISNLLSMMVGTSKGDQIVIESDMHMVWIEGWNLAYICQLYPRLVASTRGEMPLPDVESAISEWRGGYRPHTSMIAIENPHNDHGGTVLSLDYMEQLRTLADRHRVRIHLDGARLHNAAVATGQPLWAFAEHADTVALSLNKGLGAPFGSLLCGTGTDIAAAREALKRIGASGIHRAGFLAAAALYAVNNMVDRLSEDHAMARELADGIRTAPGIEVNEPETNLVKVGTLPSGIPAQVFVSKLKESGILAALREEYVFKFMLYHEIGRAEVSRTIDAVQSVARELARTPVLST